MTSSRTITQFSEDVGISLSMASRIFSAERRPSLDVLVRVADVYPVANLTRLLELKVDPDPDPLIRELRRVANVA